MKTRACVTGVTIVFFVVAALVSGCGKAEEAVSEGASPAGSVQPTQESASADEAEIAQTVCPVMAGPIDKSIYVVHEGRKVYFCCQMCVDTFKTDPVKYLEKLDAQLQTQPGA